MGIALYLLMKLSFIINLPSKETPDPHSFISEACQIFKELTTSTLHKLFQEIEGEGTHPDMFSETSMTSAPKHNKILPPPKMTTF